MSSKRGRKQSRTLEEYSRTITSEGISVRTRCYQVITAAGERYELLLDAAGQRAMVDFDAANPARLNNHIEVAAKGFAASLAVQLGDSRRL